MRISDLGAEAVLGLVASAGIIDRNPFGARKTGAEHIARLNEEAVLAGNQQADNLSLGDDDAQCLQQCQQPRHRHLRLMILSKHEAAQFRAKMPADTGRQRRCRRLAIRSLPPLAAELHDVRSDHQILHHITRIAFEPRALGGAVNSTVRSS